jgi:hypothetical protein
MSDGWTIIICDDFLKEACKAADFKGWLGYPSVNPGINAMCASAVFYALI